MSNICSLHLYLFQQRCAQSYIGIIFQFCSSKIEILQEKIKILWYHKILQEKFKILWNHRILQEKFKILWYHKIKFPQMNIRDAFIPEKLISCHSEYNFMVPQIFVILKFFKQTIFFSFHGTIESKKSILHKLILLLEC